MPKSTQQSKTMIKTTIILKFKLDNFSWLIQRHVVDLFKVSNFLLHPLAFNETLNTNIF